LIKNRFLRFLIAGFVNTLFGFLVYSGLVLAEVPVWLALAGSTVAGTLFNFITTGGYVFRDLSLARLPRFLACYVVVFATNLELIGAMTRLLGGKILAQAILALPMAGLAFLLMSWLVFVKNPDSVETTKN
jgi:putative flippase GtrA